MTAIRSKLNPRAPISKAARGDVGAGCRPSREDWADQPRCGAAAREKHSAAASCCHASAFGGCWMSDRLSWSCRNLPRGHVRRRVPRRWHHYRWEGCRGGNGHRSQTTPRERRHLFPITVKKHVRAQEIAQQTPRCLHLPGRFRRCEPANLDEVFPDRVISGGSSQPGEHVGGRDSTDRGGDGSAPLAGRMYAAMRMKRSSSEIKAPSLAGPRWGGGSRAAPAKWVREELGGADVHARISGVADPTRSTTPMRSNWRAGSFRTSPEKGDWARDPRTA